MPRRNGARVVDVHTETHHRLRQEERRSRERRRQRKLTEKRRTQRGRSIRKGERS